MKFKTSIIPITVFLVILYFLFSGLNKDPTIIPSPLIGKKIPSFESKTLIDNEIISNNDLIGNFILINVWGSWCYACTIEHENLIDIYKNEEITIYGLNYKDNREAALSWLKKRGNPYKKNIIDKDGSIGIDFGVYGAPETFLINKEGIIVYKHIGPIDRNFFKEIVLPYISK
tara:strand:+ start:715 stop:1233 length:519 start_codon:yes stop_codon:yes gene_type:complete